MSEHRHPSGRLLGALPAPGEEQDDILEDLRAFAEEIGVPGCAGMTKEEIVESLRQRYVFDSLLNRTDGIPKRRAPRVWRH